MIRILPGPALGAGQNCIDVQSPSIPAVRIVLHDGTPVAVSDIGQSSPGIWRICFTLPPDPRGRLEVVCGGASDGMRF